MFNPMTQIPQNENEAKIALKYDKPELMGLNLVGLFKIYIFQGNSLLEAYENALLAGCGESRKYPAVK